MANELYGFNTTQKASLEKYLSGIFTEVIPGLAFTQTEIENLNAWATALATKLNADAGVTDTNYDTNPQA